MSCRAPAPVQTAKAPPISTVGGSVLQRQCHCGQHTPDGECEECKQKKMTLQRHSEGSGGPLTAPPIVHELLHSPGQPLDEWTRAFFEPRFGRDLSAVRVHKDDRAVASARAVNALAYTAGNNLVFGAGRYSSADGHGKRLLAHELTHV